MDQSDADTSRAAAAVCQSPPAPPEQAQVPPEEGDELNHLTLCIAEDNSMRNRPNDPPACVTSGLPSVISLFCIGLGLGAAGGLLLGGTAVAVLQSLELLADNRLLMDQLEQYTKNCQSQDIMISMFSLLFVLVPSLLSLAVGIYVGLSTYSLVIKKEGEAVKAEKEALGLAGLVCLTVVTATGGTLGLALERYLLILLNVNIVVWFLITLLLCISSIPAIVINSYLSLLLMVASAPQFVAMLGYSYVFSLHIHRSFLINVLFPVILALKTLEQFRSFTLTTVTVPLTLIISDMYYSTGQQIIALQSPTSTDISSVVLESIFVGILISLLWMVNTGMTLCEYWQRGGADKTYAAAVSLGGAVLGAIKVALPKLGPGPSIGALMGVAGAVGVSISAAVAATDQYGQRVDHYRLVGMLGVMVGTAVGAFLSSCAHSGLSGVFMGFCAATIPAGALLRVFYSTSWQFKVQSCVVYLILVVLTLLTSSDFFYTVFASSYVKCGYCLLLVYASLLFIFTII